MINTLLDKISTFEVYLYEIKIIIMIFYLMQLISFGQPNNISVQPGLVDAVNQT
jgi:hypothetical protein